MAAGHNTSFIFPVSVPMGQKDNWVTHHIRNEVGPSIFKKGYIHFYFNKD